MTARVKLARVMYFAHVGTFGFPNGLRSWGELEQYEKEYWMNIADDVFAAFPEIEKIVERE